MFTNNFKNLMKMFAFSSYSANFVRTDGEIDTGYAHTLEYSAFIKFLSYARCKSITAIYTGTASNTAPDILIYPGVYFGTDQTPATEDDYTLGTPITSGLDITNSPPALLEHISDGVYSYSATYSVKNTGDTDVTINEIGLFLPFDTTNSSSASYLWANMLAERTVLEKPITIAPGKSKLVTYKITFNQGIV